MYTKIDRLDLIEQEQLAAQLVAVMDAHFTRPSDDQKRRILRLAESQITAGTAASVGSSAARSQAQRSDPFLHSTEG